MKFSTYQRAVNDNIMNPPAVRAPGELNAYGTGGKELNAWQNALGQVNKVLAQKQEDEDTTAVLEARNAVMTQMREKLYGENGLLTTGVGKNAEGLTQRVTQTIHETTNEVCKGLNNRVAWTLKNNISDNAQNWQRMAASQEKGEKEKYDTAVYTSSLQNQTEMSSRNYQDKDLFASGLEQTETLVLARAQKMGWSGEETQENLRNAKTGYISSVVAAAIGEEDYDTAEEYLLSNRSQMQQGEWQKLYQAVKGQKEIRENDIEAKDLFNKFYNKETGVFDEEAAMAELDKLYGKDAVKTVRSGSNAGFVYEFLSKMGYDDEACAGIMGRAQQEHNFSTEKAPEYDTVINGVKTRVGGFGIFQWQMDEAFGGRGNRLHAWAQENGLDPNDRKTQMMFMQKEAVERGLTPDKLNGKTAEEVADIWTRDYEGGKPGNERQFAADWRQKIAAGDFGGEEKTVSAYDPQRLQKIKSQMHNYYNDAERIRKAKKADAENAIMDSMKNAGSLAAAENILESNKGSLDMQDYLSLKRTIHSYYGDTEAVGGTSAGGTSGGVSPRKMQSAIDTVQAMTIKFENDQNPTADEWVKLDNAAMLLKNGGLLPEEMQAELNSLHGNSQMYSDITTALEQGNSLGEVFTGLLHEGIPAEIATIILSEVALPYKKIGKNEQVINSNADINDNEYRSD